VPVSGSYDPPPQFAPPFVPGKNTVGCSVTGGNRSVLRFTPFVFSRHSARDSAVTVVKSSGRIDCRANGGGFTGTGCVGELCSPGTGLFGNGISRISCSGLPVARSNTNTKPVFVICATASTGRPARFIVNSTGCAGRS